MISSPGLKMEVWWVMVPCEFCQKKLKEATWQVIMGSEVCGEMMELTLCDIHMKSIKYAANLIEDKCEPPHPVDEVMMQELGTDNTTIINPEHYHLTPHAAARIFEENAARYECPACSGTFKSKEKLTSHYEEQHSFSPKPQKAGGMVCVVCGKYYPGTFAVRECMRRHDTEEKWRVARKTELGKYRAKAKKEAEEMANWKPDFSGGREGPY